MIELPPLPDALLPDGTIRRSLYDARLATHAERERILTERHDYWMNSATTRAHQLNAAEARERILLARIAELERQLAAALDAQAQPAASRFTDIEDAALPTTGRALMMATERYPREYVWRIVQEARERILTERITELEKDAERYRWLRERNEAIKGIDPPGPYVVEDEDGETHYPGGAELDAAIDAARGKV